MGKVTHAVPVEHSNGHKLGGLLHYVQAASNHAAGAYRRGVRGKEMHRSALHRTGVYQARFADYIVRDVHGSHRSWRTHKRMEPHARAPRYRNAPAQTDCFELALDDTSKRWNGTPAIHVAVYGMGRPDRQWMAFPLTPYAIKLLTEPGAAPKTVRIHPEKIDVTYELEVPDREPAMWAGVDMNGNNNTYAFADGTIRVERNDFAQQYNRACSRILKEQHRDHMRKEARAIADMGCGVGYENLGIHKLYTKDGNMASYVRGKQKTTLNTGQRKQCIVSALESAGLPHAGVDPHGTSARCLGCGAKLKRSASWTRRKRNMWCQPCKKVRERDCNAGANIHFRTIFGLIAAATGLTGAGERNMTLPTITSLLGEAIQCPGISGRDHHMLSDIMRLLGGRSAGAEWRPSGAHKPGRHNPAGAEPAGGPGVDGVGRNGPGPPNAAKLCDCA